eukprot:177915_1
MDNANIHGRLERNINRINCTGKRKDIKLSVIGLCYHCCADEEKNITNVMVLSKLFIMTKDVIFVQWDDVVLYFTQSMLRAIRVKSFYFQNMWIEFMMPKMINILCKEKYFLHNTIIFKAK